jgi:hypothetical protein
MTDLGQAFTKLMQEKGAGQPIEVIADEGIPIASLSNVRGILEKVGFLTVKYFYVPADHRYMGEIVFGKSRPYHALSR